MLLPPNFNPGFVLFKSLSRLINLYVHTDKSTKHSRCTVDTKKLSIFYLPVFLCATRINTSFSELG